MVEDPLIRIILFHFEYSYGPHEIQSILRRIREHNGYFMRYVECEYTIDLVKARGSEDQMIDNYYAATRPTCPIWYTDNFSRMALNIPLQFDEEYIRLRHRKSDIPVVDFVEMCRHMYLELESPLFFTLHWMAGIGGASFSALHKKYLQFSTISPLIWENMSNVDKRKYVQINDN
jgi:hypothetical protein